MLGIRKCTMPRVASCAHIRHFCWHHHMHPVLHGLGSPNAYGCKLRPPWCTRDANWGPPDAHGCWLSPPPPRCTRDANWGPPDVHGVLTKAIIFMSKPVVRTNCVTELLELRKLIGIQANDLSVYNISQRISHGCHGRAERGAMPLETCILYCSIGPSVSSPCISAYRMATQTLLTWEL